MKRSANRNLTAHPVKDPGMTFFLYTQQRLHILPRLHRNPFVNHLDLWEEVSKSMSTIRCSVLLPPMQQGPCSAWKIHRGDEEHNCSSVNSQKIWQDFASLKKGHILSKDKDIVQVVFNVIGTAGTTFINSDYPLCQYIDSLSCVVLTFCWHKNMFFVPAN